MKPRNELQPKHSYPTRLSNKLAEQAKRKSLGLPCEDEPKKRTIYEPDDWQRKPKKTLRYGKRKKVAKQILEKATSSSNSSPTSSVENVPNQARRKAGKASQSPMKIDLNSGNINKSLPLNHYLGKISRRYKKHLNDYYDKLLSQKSAENSAPAKNSPLKLRKPNKLVKPPKAVKLEEELRCFCDTVVRGHNKLHEHLVTEHPLPTVYVCPKCNVNTKALRHNFVCKICSAFALHMKEHLKEHYRDRATDDAYMECRMCYRAFKTLDEVLEHERRYHLKPVEQRMPPVLQQGAPNAFPCVYCHESFARKRDRDIHMEVHFAPMLNVLHDKIVTLHEQMVQVGTVSVNQCPFCYRTLGGSNNGYRGHMIHCHLLDNPAEFSKSLGISEEFESLNLLTAEKIKHEQEEAFQCVEQKPPTLEFEIT